jgi:hypothetical protein
MSAIKSLGLINLTVFLLLGCPIFSQETMTRPISIFTSYIAHGAYPGLRIGAEMPLSEKVITKDGKIVKTKERATQLSLGFYHHKGFHTNFFLSSEYIFRRVKPKGFFTEFKPGLSLSRTFLGATAYEVSENGSVDKVNAAGNFYFMPSISFGMGKDFSKTDSKLPWSIYTNFNLAGLLPYNGLILPVLSLEVGTRFRLSDKYNMSIKSTTKQK